MGAYGGNYRMPHPSWRGFYYQSTSYASQGWYTSISANSSLCHLPCDSALASLRELRMGNFKLQADQRMMYDDIIDGADHVGVLLLVTI